MKRSSTSRLSCRLAALTVLAATFAQGCSRTDDSQATPSPQSKSSGTQPAPAKAVAAIHIKDDMGRSVTVAPGAGRIAALVPFAANMLLDLGVTPVLVPAIRGGGPSDGSWNDIPTAAVDHSAGPNLEQIVASRPDLIIATTVYAQFLPQIEAATNAPILVLDVNSLDDVARHIRTLGSVTAQVEKAEAMVTKVEHAAAAPATAARTESPTSVLAIFGTPHAFYGFLPESYLGDLVKRCNATLVTDGLVSHKVFQGLAPLSMEAIAAKNPDVILVVFHGPSEIATAMLAKDPAWNKLNAVVQNRVHVLSDELFVMHPGSRPIEAMTLLATALKASPRSVQEDANP